MAVDPFMPQSMYHGYEAQEWLTRQKDIRPPDPPPSPVPSSFGSGSSLPNLDFTSGSAVGDVDSLPAAGADRGYARHRGYSGPGMIASLGEGSAKMGHGIVQHVWPLKACEALGERMAAALPGVKLAVAIPCGLIAAAMVMGGGVQGAGVLVALAIGFACGWLLFSVLGFLLIVAAELVGLAIGLGLIAMVLGLAYLVITSIAS